MSIDVNFVAQSNAAETASKGNDDETPALEVKDLVALTAIPLPLTKASVFPPSAGSSLPC